MKNNVIIPGQALKSPGDPNDLEANNSVMIVKNINDSQNGDRSRSYGNLVLPNMDQNLSF